MIDFTIVKKLRDITNHVTLGFSTGKDSLVCLDLLQKHDFKVIPIYFYTFPDLEFVENNIKMYEDLFKVEVVRMPHPIFYDYLNHGSFQDLFGVKFLNQVEFGKMSFGELTKNYTESIGIKQTLWDCAGVKKADSFNRRMMLTKKTAIVHEDKKAYPIAEFSKKDIYRYLKENNIPLTDDYKYFGTSFDGITYQFLVPIRKNYPKDYEKIKDLMPLIDTEVRRYELFRK